MLLRGADSRIVWSVVDSKENEQPAAQASSFTRSAMERTEFLGRQEDVLKSTIW